MSSVSPKVLSRVALLLGSGLWFCVILSWSQETRAYPRSVHLVLDDGWQGALETIPESFNVIPLSELDPDALVASLAGGDGLVWLAGPAEVPAELWVGAFTPSESPVKVTVSDSAPLIGAVASDEEVRALSAYIRPPKQMPYHNLDEEMRAHFLPILEARDRFGQVIGYPGVLMQHFAPSSVRRRFAGSECFFFFLQPPKEEKSRQRWSEMLEAVARRFGSGIQIVSVETDYASYPVGERVQVRARIKNRTEVARAAEIRFSVRAPGQSEFRLVVSQRRVSDAAGVSEAVCDFIPEGHPGLWTVQVEAAADPVQADMLALEGHPAPIDRRQVGFVQLDGPLKTPGIVEIEGPTLLIEGRKDFWAGTHYYPSSSWWEWLWRDFRPLIADRDLAGMRKTGYRIVRIWVDPVFDETTLRAMDAAVYLAASHGIVLDVCLFTQWTSKIGFENKDGSQIRMELTGPDDFNVFGISFRRLELQREYVSVLARRWHRAGNVIYNLSNETYVRDPEPEQMDPEARSWQGIPEQPGILRDTLLFRRWAREITEALRRAGATQPVMPGYLFSLAGGGDSYLANRDGELASWHGYVPLAEIGTTVAYFDPACTARPLVLEEFGTVGWNDPAHYDGAAHQALAAGAAAALSYEWGVSWLAREMSFYPTPLRRILDRPADPRRFEPVIPLAKKWSRRGVGLHPAPSGFTYGSIYHGTPFPAEAAVALGRMGLVGEGLGRVNRPERTYLVVPGYFGGNRSGIEAISETLRQLWAEKILFGILQEDCLSRLAQDARVLICPAGVTSAESRAQLDTLRESGVEVHFGDDWRGSSRLERVSVTPGDGIELLARQTSRGTLYALMSEQQIDQVEMVLKSERLTFGLDRYALVLDGPFGIEMIEASGKVSINRAPFCEIRSARAILDSPGAPLVRSKRVRAVVTQPCEIHFSRKVRALKVVNPRDLTALAVVSQERGDGRTVAVDDQMSRYIIQVELLDKEQAK